MSIMEYNYTGLIIGIVIGQALICGFGAAFIADSKNRDPVGYFFLGALLGIIGLLVAVGVPKQEKKTVEARREVILTITSSVSYLDPNDNVANDKQVAEVSSLL
jgi:hypothetical protein